MTIAPTPAELSIEQITGLSPTAQRFWIRKGYTFSMFGAIRPPKVERAA